MSSSILNDTKHQLGLLPGDTSFDSDVILNINNALATLTQLGVGPLAGFEITSDQETWDQFTDDPRLNSVKTFVYLKVKLVFDPPGTGFVLQAMERQIEELTYRINVVVDYG